MYVQVYTVKLVASDKKKYRSHRDCIKHNDFHTRSCKVNMSKGNKIMVCVTWLRKWKNKEDN